MLEKDFQNSCQEAYAMNVASTLDPSIRQFASCITKPTLETICVIVAGWLLGGG